MFFEVHNRIPKGRPRPLLGCPGLRMPSFLRSLEWTTHSGWSLGHTLHCSHPKPPSRGRWEQERQDQPRRKNSILLGLSFQKIQCVRLHLTDKWHGVGKKTGVLFPLNSHPPTPQQNVGERPALKAGWVFAPKGAGKPKHNTKQSIASIIPYLHRGMQLPRLAPHPSPPGPFHYKNQWVPENVINHVPQSRAGRARIWRHLWPRAPGCCWVSIHLWVEHPRSIPVVMDSYRCWEVTYPRTDRQAGRQTAWRSHCKTRGPIEAACRLRHKQNRSAAQASCTETLMQPVSWKRAGSSSEEGQRAATAFLLRPSSPSSGKARDWDAWSLGFFK